MTIKSWAALSIVAGALAYGPSSASAQDIPAEYQQVLSTLGKQGDFKDNVLKVNIPRNDVKVTVAGVSTPTPFGFGGWVAMTKGDGGHQVLMGDLVLLQDEVNPVMTALLDNGFDVTALHNHFFWDEPRMYYMHVHGHGTPADLAQKLRPALALIGKSTSGSASPAAAAPAPNALNTAKLAEIVGSQGEQNGAVYKFTLGAEHMGGFHGHEREGRDRRRRGDARERSDAGLEGAAQERTGRRRDSSPHDGRSPDDRLPPLLGNGPGREARERIQGSRQRTRTARRSNGVAVVRSNA